MPNKILRIGDTGHMPQIGLGTWQGEPGEVDAAVEYALTIGYRHIDCAAYYLNEQDVGKGIHTALSNQVLSRDELWVTSKLWNSFHRPEDVIPALKGSLHALRLDYLDLYLMHWPIAFARHVGLSMPDSNQGDDYLILEKAPLLDTWCAMEEAKHIGLVRYIGVSNFSQKKLDHLISQNVSVPAVNQIERHPYLAQQSLVDYCHQHHVAVTAYAPLGSPAGPSQFDKTHTALLQHQTISDLAQCHQATPAQVLLAWQIQNNVAVIPKSTNKKRLKENLNAGEVRLTTHDIERINTLDQHHRYFTGDFFGGECSPYSRETIFNE